MPNTHNVESALTNPSFEYQDEIDRHTRQDVSKDLTVVNDTPKQTPNSNITVNTDNSDAEIEKQVDKEWWFSRLFYDGKFREKVFRTFYVLANYTFFVSQLSVDLNVKSSQGNSSHNPSTFVYFMGAIS